MLQKRPSVFTALLPRRAAPAPPLAPLFPDSLLQWLSPPTPLSSSSRLWGRGLPAGTAWLWWPWAGLPSPLLPSAVYCGHAGVLECGPTGSSGGAHSSRGRMSPQLPGLALEAFHLIPTHVSSSPTQPFPSFPPVASLPRPALPCLVSSVTCSTGRPGPSHPWKGRAAGEQHMHSLGPRPCIVCRGEAAGVQGSR